ncbi:hypothetical protein SASPL_135536 [Salvia splendens]|uniref:Uncharacterized protein n=1 Tax=Salvia splendens TaxID=180675 RepID=A0A8X8ZGQ5_SALSN|nr:hypothetical protein SASPL_135536 [Salvia splendens]
MAGQNPNMDQFEAYFQIADVDRDGRISGSEAVNFLQASNLPRQVVAQLPTPHLKIAKWFVVLPLLSLAKLVQVEGIFSRATEQQSRFGFVRLISVVKIWTFADQNRLGFLGRQEFYNALKLVTVAQSKRELTPELVKNALYGPASFKIPPPQINLGLLVPQSNAKANPSPAQLAGPQAPWPGTGVSSQALLTQPNQVTRPPRPLRPSSGFQSKPTVATHVMLGTGLMTTSPPQNLFDALGGNVDGSRPGICSQVSNNILIPHATQGEFGQTASAMTQLKEPEINGSLQSASSTQVRKDDPKPLSTIGNGFSSDSVFRDVFYASSSQAQQNSSGPAYPTTQQFQAVGQASQHVSAHKPPLFPAAAGQHPPAAGQSKGPWPRITQSDIQKYGKVFVQVDTDRDGKISGGQAHNLFLSWKLPRGLVGPKMYYSVVIMKFECSGEGSIYLSPSALSDLSNGEGFISYKRVKSCGGHGGVYCPYLVVVALEILKQVWDLSDEDNDSMLSLREFCVALYLMERYREGRHLPTVLPHSFILDDTLFPAPSQPSAVHGVTSWRPPSGFQQSQGTNNARAIPSAGPGRPPRPVAVPHPDEPNQLKAKVPELEKHLLNQLFTEEQNALNKRSEEAKDAEKKVEELEKDILEVKQKVQFYHAKMQELVLYKSRCDNRLNEISEKVVGDKREAELLSKKYEEKYMQVGDGKKMELYRAIVKLDQENADGAQDRANQVQSDLEVLMKALNERCKTYGLRAKPTSLLELPFGTAADWDEDWDKFEGEGTFLKLGFFDAKRFTYVKELTLEVQNVIAPPKLKSSFREKVSSLHNSTTGKSTSMADDNSELPSSMERVTVRETNNSEHTARTPPDSPVGSNAVASPSKEFRDLRIHKDFNMNGSPHAFDTQSEYGAWDSVSVASKEAGSLFGPDDWVLNPIRTGARGTDASLPKQGPFFDLVPSTPSNTSFPKQGPFFDSVPSTPSNTSFQKQGPFFDSVPSTPLHNLSSPHADNLLARNSPFSFADSVPTTPMYNFSSSPRKFSEGSEEQHSFDSFSRFDSFNMQDSAPFSSRESFGRFDSMRSTGDSTDFDQGYSAQPDTLTRFDSFRSTADSDYNFGAFPPPTSLTRFDSSSSMRDADYGHRFDDTADPFGSDEPFRSSHESKTPSRDSDSWKAF